MLANENPLRINDKEQEEETIAAIATPPGTGGVAIIRISGSKVPKLIPKLVTHRLKPRQATFTSFIDEQGITLDQGIAIYFPAPNSFTGEDILELHGHGGAIITDLLLERVLNEKVRIAHPGEFSERAFLNNKIDLAQAEAIADLIHASSRQAARSAMRSLTGEFSQTIDQINHFIIQARMYIEAAIDFSDEEISFLDDRTIQEKLMHILQLLRMVHQTAKQGSILCEGITVVLIGEPNVGKSSLMNHLSGENIAIVTNVPGTTRDILKQQITLDGIPIKIIDTAGLRESPDIIEQEGIKRAQQEMQRADIILYLEDVSLNAGTTLHPLFAPNDCPVIHIKNKIDLIGKEPSIEISSKNQAIIFLSAQTGAGIKLLKKHIKSIIGFQTEDNSIFLARRRHLAALTTAANHISSSLEIINGHPPELAAEDLRLAHLSLNEITGKFTSDDLLGEIFSNFCIGK